MVRGQLQRELRNQTEDIVLLFLERMQQIDFLHNWAQKTLGQLGETTFLDAFSIAV
jgi:hypothetical protein